VGARPCADHRRMVEFTVRLDSELRDTIRRIAAEESAATHEVSLACIARRALRDYAARRRRMEHRQAEDRQ
jgi:predicted transcriptional regulator